MKISKLEFFWIYMAYSRLTILKYKRIIFIFLLLIPMSIFADGLSETYDVKKHLVRKNTVVPGQALEVQLDASVTEWRIELHNLNSEKILTVPESSAARNIDVDGKQRYIIHFDVPDELSPGVYLLYIRTNEQAYRVKILIQDS